MFARFFNLIKGKLESVLTNAEDPAIVLDQAIAEMRNSYNEAVQKLGAIRYEKDRLGAQLYQLRATNNPQAEVIGQQYETIKEQYKQGLQTVRYMKNELDKMIRDSSGLKASATAASIHKKVEKITDITNKNSAFGRFISAEERIHQQISAVQVRRDLGAVNFQRSGYLPSGRLDVDAELAKLESEIYDSLPAANHTASTVIQQTTWNGSLTKFPEFPPMPQMPTVQ